MPRNIVVLLDGTGNQFCDRNTDLIRLKSLLSESEDKQLVYYSSGLGTVLPVGTSHWGKLRRQVAQVIDMATAPNFADFVCDAYRFLVDYCKEGDQVYLFGFSRGAYVARVLAGMIQRVGLLSQGNHNQIRPAYEFYKAWKYLKDWNEAAIWDDYKKIFGISRVIKIHFLGVWDTVSSLGGFGLPYLPFAGSPAVTYFRHALALDERRARFVPEYLRTDFELWRYQRMFEEEFGQRWRSTLGEEIKMRLGQRDRADKQQLKRISSAPAELNAESSAQAGGKSNSSQSRPVLRLEVWFRGAHSDVGGGVESRVPRASFRWMLREAARCDILLNYEAVAEYFKLPPGASQGQMGPAESDPVRRRMESRWNELVSSVADHRPQGQRSTTLGGSRTRTSIPIPLGRELVDFLAENDLTPPGNGSPLPPFHDSLTFWWWPLEVIPLKTRNYTPDGPKTGNKVRMNFGGGRQMIRGQRIHKSVLQDLRQEHTSRSFLGFFRRDRPYRPAAKVAGGMPPWDEIAELDVSDELFVS